MSIPANGITSCQQVDDYLDERFREAGELPEEVSSHVRSCPRCGKLLGWIVEVPPEKSAPGELAASIAAQLDGDLEPVKPLPSNTVLVFRFLAVFGALGVLFTLWMGPAGIEQMNLPQIVLVAGLLAAGAILLALSLSWQMAPGTYQRVPVKVMVGAFAAGFLVVVAALFPWNVQGVLDAGWGCTRIGMMMAVPVGGILLYLAMRGAPLSYPALGASLGAASGLLALTVLQFSCHMQEASHIILWHGAVVLLSIGAGYGLGLLADYFARRARA